MDSTQGKLISSLMSEILEIQQCQAIRDRITFSAILPSSAERATTTDRGPELDTFSPHNLRPASKAAVIKLPKCRVLPHYKDRYKDENRTCGICCGRLVDGFLLTRLPCGHVYHLNCVVPWFNKANSCPECRYEIPTCDETYETGRQQRMCNRTIVSCTCDPHRPHHTCFFDDSKLVVQADKNENA